MYNKLLNKYEACFWALKNAKTIIKYYHLLADFDEVKKELKLYKEGKTK